MNPGMSLLFVNLLGWGALIGLVAFLIGKRNALLEELHQSHRALARSVGDLERELRDLTTYLKEKEEIAKISVGSASKDQKSADEDEAFRLGSSGVRWKAVVAAGGKQGDPAALEPLIKSLKDESVRVRLGALTTLAKHGDRSVVPHLAEALEDPNEVVRRRAARSLQELTHEDLGESRQAWLRWWEKNRS